MYKKRQWNPYPLESMDLIYEIKDFRQKLDALQDGRKWKKIVPLNGKTMAVCALLIARGRMNASKNSVLLKWNLV